MYKSTILLYAPSYWNKMDAPLQTELKKNNEEFLKISLEIQEIIHPLIKPIKKIIRIQNVHDLGQCLIREQLLLAASPEKTFYRVRRFLIIKKCYLSAALKNNLDYRRCGIAKENFKFSTKISSIHSDELLIVVQIISTDILKKHIIPENSLDYFIDYLIEF